MKEPLEVIVEIKNFISSQNPLRFPHQETLILNLLTELENILNPQPIEEPIVEVVEETVIEEPVVEETVIEEPIVEEVVAPKKTTTRKK